VPDAHHHFIRNNVLREFRLVRSRYAAQYLTHAPRAETFSPEIQP
jgi:hypothetical protein